MADLKQFKLPDIGEGLTEADVLTWHVKVGDVVEVNQIIVEVETAKAAVELPSPFAGLVTALHVDEGATVDVGTPIITIDVAPGAVLPPVGSADGIPSLPVSTSDPASDITGAPTAVPGEPQRQSVLVGYGPRAEGGTSRRRPRKDPVGPSAQTGFDPPPAAPSIVLAKPPVRKLAKSLGVDLGQVRPTGPNGTVSRDDVAQAANGPGTPRPASAGSSAARETRIPIKGVRKHTANAMVTSAFTAPHVTEFVTIDMSATMQLRERVGARREFGDVKVSPLVFLARAVILAAARTPEINASWDEAAGEIAVKHYVNLGIAAATDRGLIVPNVKDADQLSLLELARAIAALTELARSGKTPPAHMSGGTITITNVGVFGVDTGTPILNPGEAGIVAFGAVRRMPWVVPGIDGGSETIEPRWVTQLAVSFDHRVVDGQQGSQFLSDVGALLTDPGLAML
ncbi:MAG: 2-oxo acid dehydrogenase subunit E2 [Actinomycetota bacterium]|nr:2-oxo acid dehydrogenase subunit E2 [Actinomycetota bacterium]